MLSRWIYLLGLMVVGTGVVSGQNYPNKPIRIVTTGVGGLSDLTARLVAPVLAGNLGQPVIVDNRGSGISTVEIVVKAPPDGHSILFYGNTIWTSPFMRSDLSYDPVRDFAPITLVGSAQNILVVHPSVAVNSVKDLIALAKAKPGTLNFGSSGPGSATHLAAELFKAMAGVDIVHVPYRGGGPAVVALIGGQVHLMFASAGSAAQQVKAGRLKALAVTGAQPSVLFSGLPTVAASGVPGYESVSVSGVLAPSKLPKALVTRLNQEILKVLGNADIKERFLAASIEVIGSSPEQFAAFIKADMARWGKVIRDAGIREE